MTIDRSDDIISSLIVSRFAHDLASPLGAIGNGLELLESSGVPVGPEIELVQHSLTNATAKLRLYRAAFAKSKSLGGDGPIEMEPFLTDWAAVYKLKPDIGCTFKSTEDRRLVLLAMMCMESSFPTGGKLSVTRDNGHITITASGPKVLIRADHWSLITGSEAPVELPDASKVQYLITANLAQALGRTCVFKSDDASATLSIHE